MRKIIDIKKNNKFIINTPNYILKLLDKSHVSKKYLGWLNDKKTSEFTYRRDKIFNLIDIKNHIKEHEGSKNTLSERRDRINARSIVTIQLQYSHLPARRLQ